MWWKNVIVFDTEDSESQSESFYMNRQMDTAYDYRVQYHFDPAAGWDAERYFYEPPLERTEDRTKHVNPYDHIGFMEIAQDFADIVLVGGMEHMTRVPMGGATIDRGVIVPNMALFMDPDYQHWDMMTAMNMGLTAEKLFAQTDFTKEDMDKWGVRSHQLAAGAQEEGFFNDEIMPIEAERRKPRLTDQMQVTAKERPEEIAKVIKTMMVE